MGRPRKLKRVVLKEELVALTGHHISALILNQLLYWTERMDDVDRFLREEQARQHDVSVTPTHGWIYKSAGELVDELMLGLSEVTVRSHLAKLLERGFVAERRNPMYHWDRTLQYRVNVVAIQDELASLGYALDDYPLVQPETHAADSDTSVQSGGVTPEAASDDQPAPNFKMKDRGFKMKDRNFNAKDRGFNSMDRTSTMSLRSFREKDRSVVFEGAIPEITTEITSETPTETTSARRAVSNHAPAPAHHDRRVIVELEALGLSRRQATRAVQRHQLTRTEVERWARWMERLTQVSNPVALLAATIDQQRLPPGEPVAQTYDQQLGPTTPPTSDSDTSAPCSVLWASVCATLQQQLADNDYATWIADAHLLDVDEDRAVIGTPNVFARDKLATAYLTPLSDALREHLGRGVSVEIVIDGGAE